MSITNLLARGFDPMPAGGQANALMQVQQLRAGQQRNALMQQQMQAAQAAQAEQAQNNALMRDLVQSIPSPQMQASQQALQGGGGPTVANAAKMPQVDPRTQMLHTMMQQSNGKLVSPVDYINQALPAPEKPRDMVVDGAIVRVQGGNATPIYKGEQKDPENVRLLKMIHGDGTPAFQAALAALGAKTTTHAPAAQAISYGSPVPFVGADGSIQYAQPGNRPGAAPQVMVGPDGKPLVKPGEAEKALTEGQAKAVAFASRMESADKVMAELSSKGVNKSIPGGMGNNMIGSAITAMAPADQQKLMQAKRNFVNAILRRESGAVISPEEFANADRQYFPQPGEGPEVIQQKARERRVAIDGMRADVPKTKQGDVDRISGGAAAPTVLRFDAQGNPVK